MLRFSSFRCRTVMLFRSIIFEFSTGMAIFLIFSGVYFVTQSKSRAQLDAELAEKGTVGGKGK